EFALQAFEFQDLVDTPLEGLALGTELYHYILGGTQTAPVDAAHTDLADVAAVVQGNNLHLQGSVRVILPLRNVVQNGLKQGSHVATAHVFGQAGVTRQPRGVDDGEIELFLSGTQFVEEVKRGVDRMVWTRTWAVDLVNHHNGLETQRQGLARHEARLGHRALYGVDQQKHAVYHGKHALNFATEVRVSRGINDVDMNAFIFDSAVLGQNGDTPFLFDVTGVHDPFCHLLVVA